MDEFSLDKYKLPRISKEIEDELRNTGTKTGHGMNGHPDNPVYHYNPINGLWYPPSEEEYELARIRSWEKREARSKERPEIERMYPYSSLSCGLPHPKNIPNRSLSDLEKERQNEMRTYIYSSANQRSASLIPSLPPSISEQEMISKRRYDDNSVKYDKNVKKIETEVVNTKNWSFEDAYNRYEKEHRQFIEPERKDMWNIKV